MSDLQDALKNHSIKRLDREAAVHSSGHQNVHARRYVVPHRSGRSVEVAIIVKPDSKLQIWCEAAGLDVFSLGDLPERRPGSETYARTGPTGNLLYGRHSALKTFDRLHRGDALRFVPASIGEVDRILDTIGGLAP